MSSDSELLSLKKKRKKGMNILGGRGDLTQILDLFPIFEKISDIFGRRCVQCTCVCDSAIIWKRLDSFFGWSLNLKVFVVALHMNTQLWYRKGYKIPKKNWDTLLCIALVSVTAQLFAPTTAHHPQAWHGHISFSAKNMPSLQLLCST